MEFYPACHIVPGVTANSYLLLDPQGVGIIDTGLPGSAEMICDYLRSLGKRPEDVRWILITHADDDHYGGLRALQKLTMARTATSAAEADAIRKGGASRPLKFNPFVRTLFNVLVRSRVRARAAVVDDILVDDQVLPLLGGLMVIATPGHTPGHLSFYLEKHAILLAGDSLRAVRNQLICSTGVNNWDEQQALQSMRKQARLNPKIICCGHGTILDNRAGDLFFAAERMSGI
jgi:glyoxylase-like metal-dependent hydrolase (beta-lactamase superfamily II)